MDNIKLKELYTFLSCTLKELKEVKKSSGIPEVPEDGNVYARKFNEWVKIKTIKGKDGKSAYDLAKEQGFDGSVEEWLQSLKGAAGEQGFYYQPTVDSNGNLSWINNGNLPNPPTINIKGSDGVSGQDGQTLYTWIRFANNPEGNNMTVNPISDTKYMGIAYNKPLKFPSTNKSDYTWVRIKGSDATVDTSLFLQKGGYDGTANTLKESIDTKVDKVPGKSLSTNDYSNEEKNKVTNLGKKVVKSLAITGDINKRLTLTFEDGNILTADFIDKDTLPPGITPDVMLNSMEFDTGTGIFTGVRSDGQRITANLNGRFALLNHNHNDLYNTKQEITNFLTGKVDTTDPRLTDSRNAKDVPDWAKQPAKPTYSYDEITGLVNELLKYLQDAPKDGKDYLRNNGLWKMFDGIPYRELRSNERLNDIKELVALGQYNSAEVTVARDFPNNELRGGVILSLPMTLNPSTKTIFHIFFSAGTKNAGVYTNSARILMRAFVNNSEWLPWREFDGGKIHNVTENSLNLANAYKGFPVDNSVFVLNQATTISVPNSVLRCRFIKNTSGDITFSKASGVTIIGKETISLPEGTEISLVCNGNRAYVNTGSGESVSINHDIGAWD